MKILKKIDHWLVIHAAIVLACVVGIVVFTLSHKGANAEWDTGNYCGYSAGVYQVTAPAPGIHHHYAQHINGAPQDIGVIMYDPNPPTLESTSMVFAADAAKSISLRFSDHGLSGIVSVEARIAKPDGSTTTYSASGESLSFTHDFSKVGNYSLQYRATDNATNDSGWLNYNNFFRVVAATPEWNASNCSGNNYQTTCPSTLTPSTGLKVADGETPHTVVAKLSDKYGNRVISVSGIKTVGVTFKFNNTTQLDQIAGVGDSARLLFPETGVDLIGVNTGSTKIKSTGVLIENSSPNGEYTVEVRSYAPTGDGYPAVLGSSFRLGFNQIEYLIAAASGFTGVGEANNTKTQENYFGFSPALTALPQAMNFNTTSGSYEASDAAAQNITINAAKRFLISLSDASVSKNTSKIELGLLMQTNDEDVVWDNAALERSHGIDVSNTLNLVTTQPMTSTWNTIPAAGDAVSVGATKYLRMKSTPTLALGAQTSAAFATLFRTHVGYDINGRHPRHRSEKLSLGEGDAEVNNTNIEVIGASHSDSTIGFLSTLEGQDPNATLGDVFRSEFRTAITRNISAYTKDPAAIAKACKNASYTITSSNWNTLPCAFQSGSVLYFEGANVVFEDNTASALRLPSGARTIIVNGGDVSIKSNLIYSTANDSFGIVLLKKDDGDTNPLDDGGNLFIYPEVTNIVAALYAEGSVTSVNRQGDYTEYTGTNCPADGLSGFCDRSTELRNQVYWQGSLISQNTIGGSDTNPPSCPSAFEDACSGQTDNRAFSRIFDLNYLRTFHATSGGKRAGGLNIIGLDMDATLPNPPGGVTNNHAFIIKYDSRIKLNTPPLFSDTSSSSGGEVGF
jgi:hypothetical protein